MPPITTDSIGTSRSTSFVAGNYYDKYRTKNRIHAYMVRNFVDRATDLVHSAGPRRILEVGCGSGDLAARLLAAHGEVDYVGIDISMDQVEMARSSYGHLPFARASIYQLPFADDSFDLVIACEVMEHLERPQAAIEELRRVCADKLLLSVPWEPIWRILNFIRGKYVSRLGNTPGHVQHFTRSSIRRLVGTRFSSLVELRPVPWTMILASKRRD